MTAKSTAQQQNHLYGGAAYDDSGISVGIGATLHNAKTKTARRKRRHSVLEAAGEKAKIKTALNGVYKNSAAMASSVRIGVSIMASSSIGMLCIAHQYRVARHGVMPSASACMASAGISKTASWRREKRSVSAKKGVISYRGQKGGEEIAKS